MRKSLEIKNQIRKITDFKPRMGLVLGSGLGNLIENMDIVASIDYCDLEGMPRSSAPGHEGRYILGYIEGLPIIAMQGRVHLYEGYSPDQVVLPIRVMGELGIEIIMLTNAAGAIDESFKEGDLMIIEDQISSFVDSPLIGENDPDLGVRFPDMTYLYNRGLIKILEEAADEENIDIKKGTYIQFKGPQYESPAEIRMARILGAQAVGMSTTIEAIAAHHMGIKVSGLSFLSNMAAGIKEEKLNEKDVIKMGQETSEKISLLIKSFIRRLSDF